LLASLPYEETTAAAHANTGDTTYYADQLTAHLFDAKYQPLGDSWSVTAVSAHAPLTVHSVVLLTHRHDPSHVVVAIRGSVPPKFIADVFRFVLNKIVAYQQQQHPHETKANGNKDAAWAAIERDMSGLVNDPWFILYNAVQVLINWVNDDIRVLRTVPFVPETIPPRSSSSSPSSPTSGAAASSLWDKTTAAVGSFAFSILLGVAVFVPVLAVTLIDSVSAKVVEQQEQHAAVSAVGAVYTFAVGVTRPLAHLLVNTLILAPKLAASNPLSSALADGLEHLRDYTMPTDNSVPAIAFGTRLALVDIATEDLAKQLEGKTTIDVVGHSLGGCLASVLAPWIQAHVHGQPQVRVTTFAAPTAGNQAFVRKLQAQIGANFRRVINPLDLMPLAWNTQDLYKILHLYSAPPAAAVIPPVFKYLIDVIVFFTAHCDYAQPEAATIVLDRAQQLHLNFGFQIAHQHDYDTYVRLARSAHPATASPAAA